jgi:hypothetical protein
MAPVGKSGVYNLADMGDYFIARNPTPGTGLAGIAAADGLDDTEGTLLVRNSNSAKRVYLDYLKLRVTVAGTNGTNAHFASKIDQGNRYTSGGTAIAPVNVNMASSNTAGVTGIFGALVTTAATAGARLVGAGVVRRATIVVAGDEYFWDFGGRVPADTRPATIAADSTTNVSTAIAHCPVVLGPGDSWWFSVYSSSQTVGTSFEYELGFWVR